MPISTIGANSLAQSRILTAVQQPVGTVLQVVSASINSQISTTSTSAVTTGLSASITPTSSTSKILVLMDCGATESTSGTGTQANFWLYRGGSSIFRISNGAMYSSSGSLGPSCNYFDSPATTSSTTYTIYFAGVTGNQLYFCSNSSGASMTLLEIAA